MDRGLYGGYVDDLDEKGVMRMGFMMDLGEKGVFQQGVMWMFENL